MSSSTRVALVFVLLGLGCGPRAQRAAIIPAPSLPAPLGTAPRGETSLGFHPAARNYVVDPSRSRFEAFGSDVITGEHKMTFHVWRAEVSIAQKPTISVDVETASVEVEMAGATSAVKRSLLEVHRFPSATLTGTLTKTDGGPDEHVVEGTAEIHGVRKGLRFVGHLKEEGDGYRFSTDFVISRKEFDIRYTPIEPFLRDDVRIVVDAFAKPVAARAEQQRKTPTDEREETPSSKLPSEP